MNPPPPSASALLPWQRIHAALMPDYNRRATAYWWTLVALGTATLAGAAAHVAALPWDAVLRVLVGSAIAMVAGLFPIRIPGSKNSFAAGEVFILLLLLLDGAQAAAVAAAGEAFVGSARSSKRWTSRIVSPAAAAVSMVATGALLAPIASLLGGGPAGLLVGAIVVAVAHFALNTAFVTAVVHLKRCEWPQARDLVGAFAWVGTTYAASALLAGLLVLAFQASGIGVMAGGVPLIVLLLVMLHYHFRQREIEQATQRLRVETAEREAAQSASHLRALRESEERFHSAFAHAAIGMALVSPKGLVLQANPALAALLGCADAAVVGRKFVDFFAYDDRPLLYRQWLNLRADDALDDGADGRTVELRCRRAGGDVAVVAVHSAHFAFSDGGADAKAAPCLIVQAQDVTARRDAEARLHHIAYHDSLTSLANRMRFGVCLAQAIERQRADPACRFGVMYLDFDRFKLINDTLGHQAGDRFLTLCAARIREHVRPADTVGRLGGDEFAILVESAADDSAIVAMAERLQTALAAPYDVDGNVVNSSASIGITFGSVGYEHAGDVLRDADIAMYRAKAAGRARIAVFDASLRAQLAERVDIERDLRGAIERDELSLVYQPIVALAGDGVDSFEALVRWNHPERGPLPPATFIPIAEESTLIGALTAWVLNAACAHLRALQAAQPRLPRPRVHVNVSGLDMCRPSFVSEVATALLSNGLEPRQLTLEITETRLMQRLDSALDGMARLRELGVGLSIDDFGTGWSSLSYLSTLPITSLKIDRSFVQRLDGDAKDAEVVRAVITLGLALGKTVIAEGIETRSQLAKLLALGCKLGQGYLLAMPLTPDEVAGLLHGADQPPAQAPLFTTTHLALLH